MQIGIGIDPTFQDLAALPVLADDTTPPAAATSLTIPAGWNLASGCRLQAIAPGDDAMSGIAIEVAARAALAAIVDETTWTAATDLTFSGTGDTWKSNAVPAGQEWGAEVTANPFPGLVKHVVIRFRDDAGNVGAISSEVIWDESDEA